MSEMEIAIVAAVAVTAIAVVLAAADEVHRAPSARSRSVRVLATSWSVIANAVRWRP
ncbi:hypothetical protein [Allonocardiopsis opalescens]|uniref:Uncharacterized protein n=1 Tax=Allonocardiopsis opalescens TaxID=1144618 RepID=A0A2T0PW52_9ACTN|nr:hypothetical protein [Allonocardiopsis opalescens]PRX95588.1 hypothetical protein CLV72_109197 [Allonocardiopsis opalescens]